MRLLVPLMWLISIQLFSHCTENPIYVFPGKELCGHNSNSYIHVSVSNLYYIPRIGPHIGLQQIHAERSWKYINLSQIYECRNWETEHTVMEITRLHSFLSVNTIMGTRHLYWILTGPSFAVRMKVATITIHFFFDVRVQMYVLKTLLSLILSYSTP